jgi:hypothetical protein
VGRLIIAALCAVGVACRQAAPEARRPAPAFACDGGRCVQRAPRMPDDGEWACADSGGPVVCVGGERAAGVAAAPPDPAWRCGARAGANADGLGRRICVDLAPDFPDGRMAGWRCSTLHDGPLRRVCDRDPAVHTLADACDDRRPCLDGAWCAEGRCRPERRQPDCWLDRDCGTGLRCRFGSCLGGRP